MRTRGSMMNDVDGKKLLNLFLGALYPDDIYPSCITCRQFNDAEICKLVGKHPPAKIIVRGCEAYQDAYDIPF